MTGDARVLETGPVTFDDERIAVADAAGLDFDPHRTGAGRWDFAFDDFKGTVGTGDLGDTHLGHVQEWVMG